MRERSRKVRISGAMVLARLDEMRVLLARISGSAIDAISKNVNECLKKLRK